MAANDPKRNYAKSRQADISDDRWAAARALYESKPGMSYPLLAAETGIPKSILQRRGLAEDWTKARDPAKLAEMSAAAQEVADRFNGKAAEYGDEISADQKAAAVAELVHDTAILERGKVIDRHRREWAAPRKLIYDGVKTRDFDLCKIAKWTAETLQVIQNAERRAWGLDQPAEADSKNTVVVIERE